MRLEFEERLSGAYRRPGERDRPLRLELRGAGVLRGPLRFSATGRLTAAGLVDGATVEGTIELCRPWTLTYLLQFMDGAGSQHLLVAHKRQLREDAYAGFTTLRGRIVDRARDAPVASFGARFDARGDLAWWLRSLKLLVH